MALPPMEDAFLVLSGAGQTGDRKARKAGRRGREEGGREEGRGERERGRKEGGREAASEPDREARQTLCPLW